MPISTPQEIIEDIRQGKMVILMDDEDRENEGDLIMAAEHITSSDQFYGNPWSRPHLFNAHERALSPSGFKSHGAR